MDAAIEALAKANRALELTQAGIRLVAIVHSHGNIQIAQHDDAIDRQLDKYTPVSGVGAPAATARWLGAFTVGVWTQDAIRTERRV